MHFCNRICKFITLHYSISKFKGEKFRSKLLRIGSVATLETIVFYSTLVAWIILILSTILGAQWGIFAVGKQIFIDPKVIFSTIITLLYGVYIFIRIKNGYHKEILSTLTLYYFVCV